MFWWATKWLRTLTPFGGTRPRYTDVWLPWRNKYRLLKINTAYCKVAHRCGWSGRLICCVSAAGWCDNRVPVRNKQQRRCAHPWSSWLLDWVATSEYKLPWYRLGPLLGQTEALVLLLFFFFLLLVPCPSFVHLAGQTMVGEQGSRGASGLLGQGFGSSIQECVTGAKNITERASPGSGTWPWVVKET